MCRFFVGNFLGILICLLFGLQPSMRDYLALKENSKTSLEGLVRSRSDSGSEWGTKLVQRPHPPIASQCMIAFVCAKYRNDLILADFNLAAGRLIRQTAKFNSPPKFSSNILLCHNRIPSSLWPTLYASQNHN